MKKSLTLALGAMMLAGMATTSEAAINRADQFITVLTGPTSGIYFPIGGAFDKALKDYGYNSSSTATGASGENINAILTGQGELAIAMSDAVLQAYDAYGAFQGKKPAKNLKMLMSLWPNYCQLVTTEDSGIKKFEDLKGRRVGVGAPNSGVEVNARMMFEAHKMSYKDCKVDYLSYGEGIKQMMN
ncbi:MAG: TAXI family TRAP transporter solute-binding subunit, partial [Acidaminococcaceae bacterium]|nr:TAXI family TRAP transporter solute-binding subunit [Acidaminococcaceae bacterium]